MVVWRLAFIHRQGGASFKNTLEQSPSPLQTGQLGALKYAPLLEQKYMAFVTAFLQVQAAAAEQVAAYGGVDVLISNAGRQIEHPIESYPFVYWKMLAIQADACGLPDNIVDASSDTVRRPKEKRKPRNESLNAVGRNPGDCSGSGWLCDGKQSARP